MWVSAECWLSNIVTIVCIAANKCWLLDLIKIITGCCCGYKRWLLKIGRRISGLCWNYCCGTKLWIWIKCLLMQCETKEYYLIWINIMRWTSYLMLNIWIGWNCWCWVPCCCLTTDVLWHTVSFFVVTQTLEAHNTKQEIDLKLFFLLLFYIKDNDTDVLLYLWN